MKNVSSHGLQIAPVLFDFVEKEVLPGTGVSSEAFWSGVAGLVRVFAPRNRELLAVRDDLQRRIEAIMRRSRGDLPMRRVMRLSCERSTTSVPNRNPS